MVYGPARVDTRLVAVAAGREKADLAVVNGKLVNVYSREVYPGGVAICGDRIACVGEVGHCIGEQTRVIDAAGRYLLPGFVDGHIHPESTNLSIRQFAEVVLAHGTTAIMTDLHEVGVVGGMPAIEAVLAEAAATPLGIFFVVPSHVPFSPGLETSGGHVDSQVVAEAIRRPDAVGLSEIVAPYLLMGMPDLIRSMELTLAAGRGLHGHAPETSGPALQAYLASGVLSDHESLSTEDALQRVRLGCYLMMREGSVAHNLADCLKVLTEHRVDPSMCSIITDDLDTIDAVEKGHLDHSLRLALGAGIDFPTAVQLVTLNPARAYGLDRHIGSLAPGRRADVNITTGPEDFRVETVIAAGQVVVEGGRLLRRQEKAVHQPFLLNTVKLARPVTADDFGLRVSPPASRARVKVMRTLDWIPITVGQEATLPVKDGIVQADPDEDILYIAQVERYGKGGRIGQALMAGFNLKAGAIASTIAHDNHNVVVLGVDRSDMALAVNRLAELGGGQIVVRGGRVLEEVPFPVLGLLSDEDAWSLAEAKRRLIAAARGLGCTIGMPFMFLSFITLAAIPEYAVTDHGFVDVAHQAVVDPVLAVE